MVACATSPAQARHFDELVCAQAYLVLRLSRTLCCWVGAQPAGQSRQKCRGTALLGSQLFGGMPELTTNITCIMLNMPLLEPLAAANGVSPRPVRQWLGCHSRMQWLLRAATGTQLQYFLDYTISALTHLILQCLPVSGLFVLVRKPAQDSAGLACMACIPERSTFFAYGTVCSVDAMRVGARASGAQTNFQPVGGSWVSGGILS